MCDAAIHTTCSSCSQAPPASPLGLRHEPDSSHAGLLTIPGDTEPFHTSAALPMCLCQEMLPPIIH